MEICQVGVRKLFGLCLDDFKQRWTKIIPFRQDINHGLKV